MAKARGKRLSSREKARVDAKRQAHLNKRSEAEMRNWQRQNIDPLFEQFSPFNEPDDVRVYPSHPHANKPDQG